MKHETLSKIPLSMQYNMRQWVCIGFSVYRQEWGIATKALQQRHNAWLDSFWLASCAVSDKINNGTPFPHPLSWENVFISSSYLVTSIAPL